MPESYSSFALSSDTSVDSGHESDGNGANVSSDKDSDIDAGKNDNRSDEEGNLSGIRIVVGNVSDGGDVMVRSEMDGTGCSVLHDGVSFGGGDDVESGSDNEDYSEDELPAPEELDDSSEGSQEILSPVNESHLGPEFDIEKCKKCFMEKASFGIDTKNKKSNASVWTTVLV